MLDSTGIPLFKMKAAVNVPLLVIASLGACFALTGCFGTPVETYVSVDLVKKVVSALFTMYNIRASASLTPRSRLHVRAGFAIDACAH